MYDGRLVTWRRSWTSWDSGVVPSHDGVGYIMPTFSNAMLDYDIVCWSMVFGYILCMY
jgi:hypothetical protein